VSRAILALLGNQAPLQDLVKDTLQELGLPPKEAPSSKGWWELFFINVTLLESLFNSFISL